MLINIYCLLLSCMFIFFGASCNYTVSYNSIKCNEIEKIVIENEYVTEVFCRKDSLFIRLRVTEDEALEIRRLRYVDYCLIYDLKEVVESFKIVKFIHDTPRLKDENLVFPINHIQSVLLDYKNFPNKYDVHKYIYTNFDSESFNRIEFAYQNYINPNQKIDVYHSLFMRDVNSIIEVCANKNAGQKYNLNFEGFIKYIDGLNKQHEDPYLTSQELEKLNFVIRLCDKK